MMRHTQCYYCHGIKDVQVHADNKFACIYCRGENKRYSRVSYYLAPEYAAKRLRGKDFEDGKECRQCRKLKVEWDTKRKRFYCSETCSLKFRNEEYMPHFVWSGIREGVYKRDNGCCVFCKREIALNNAQIDHIKAIVNGGDETDYSNLQTLCKDCHIEKTKKDILERKSFLKKDVHGEQQQKLFSVSGGV